MNTLKSHRDRCPTCGTPEVTENREEK